VHPPATRFLRAWSEREAPWERTGAWVAVGVLAVTPLLGGHAAAGPYAAFGATIGVLHFSAAAVWFGGLVLLGTCALPHADEGLLAALPRFSSVAFAAMVTTVVTGSRRPSGAGGPGSRGWSGSE
jgi:putative copper export protein